MGQYESIGERFINIHSTVFILEVWNALQSIYLAGYCLPDVANMFIKIQLIMQANNQHFQFNSMRDNVAAQAGVKMVPSYWNQ